MKYIRVVFTDRQSEKAPPGKVYTYNKPNFDFDIGSLVVVQAGSGFGIGQIVGEIDKITFDPKLLKEVQCLILQ